MGYLPSYLLTYSTDSNSLLWFSTDIFFVYPKRTQVTALGTATVPLSCTSTSGIMDLPFQTGIPTGTPFRETLCKSSHSDTAIPLSSLSSTALRPYALEEPWIFDYLPGTCLLRHLSTTGWDVALVGMIIFLNGTTGTTPTTAEVGFFANRNQLRGGNGNRVAVPLLPGTAYRTDGSKWVDCLAPPWQSGQDRACHFQFDSATGRFTLKRFTQCNDVDKKHPYVMLPLLQ